MAVHHIINARELADAGRREDAVTCLVAAIADDPQSVPLHLELGHLHLSANLFAEADKCFLQAAGIEPDNATAHLGRSTALLGLQNIPESLAEIDAAVRLEPRRAELHTHRGHVLCRLGRPDDGQRAYRKALDLDPADETACFVLCHLLEHRAQIAESVLLLRRFAAENPTEVKLCLHLARLLERTGDRDGAVDAYRDVLVRDPANPDARGALARLSPPSWASGWTGAPPVARSANTLPSLAVITMVYNESDFLPIWLRHYSRAVGAENCFILDHGSDDDSTANLAPVNVIRVPRSPHDNQRRAAAMSDLASSLLRWYDFVAYTDADEMLVAHPGRFESLRHFCARMTAGTTTAFGLNVLHRLEKDGPLDPAAAISLQRGWAFPLSSMAKPILTSEPVRWVPGFHSYNGPPRFDGLFNFHLAYADRSLALRRQAKRRASPIKVKPNDPVHHHLASDEAVLNWMAVWSQLPERHDTTLDAHCPAYSEFVTKIIESYARCKNHTMKIDLGLWGDALWRIPDGFLQTF